MNLQHRAGHLEGLMFSRKDHVTAFQNVQNKVIVCYPTAYRCNVTLQQSVVSRISNDFIESNVVSI